MGITRFDLVISAYFAATDARDKVYGILGLVTSFDDTFGIIPDYTKSVQEVFTDAISLQVQADPARLYNHLPLHALRNDAVTKCPTLNGLPSWVMDLTTSSRQLGIYDAYNLPNTLLQHVGLKSINTQLKRLDSLVRVSPNNTLHAAGAYIGTIIEISQDLPLSPLEEKQATAPYSISAKALKDIYDHMLRPRNIPLKTLWEALCAGSVAKGCPDIEFREPYHEIPFNVDEKTLFVTKESHVAISYHPDPIQGIRPGDVVVGLFGVSIPFILRPADSGEEYQMVNVAYVADHNYCHAALESTPKGTTQDDVWNDLAKFGLQEYRIV
jgi:hypothetical protein